MPKDQDAIQHYSRNLENELFDLTGGWRKAPGWFGRMRLEVEYETSDRKLAYRGANWRQRRVIARETPSLWD